MRLSKIVDGRLQAYYIDKPTPAFKKHFTKKYNYVTIFSNGQYESKTTDVKSPDIHMGYLFTYDKSFHVSSAGSRETDTRPQAWPESLNRFFEPDFDVVLKCIPYDKSPTPLMTGEYIIRTHSATITNGDIRNKVLSNLIARYEAPVDVEEFVESILNHPPLSFKGATVRYPDVIEDGKCYKFNSRNLSVMYDVRSRDNEGDVIRCLEQAFAPVADKDDITINDTFSGIVDRISKSCESKSIQYIIGENEYGQKHIKLKYKDLYSLPIKYDITDFF